MSGSRSGAAPIDQSDLLTRIRREMDGRMEELKPVVDEARRLGQALEALDGNPLTSALPSTQGRTRASRGHRAGATETTRSSKRSVERRLGGEVPRRVIEIVTATPGMSSAGIAAKLPGTSRKYVTNVLGGLVGQGRLDRRDGRYFPVESSAPQAAG